MGVKHSCGLERLTGLSLSLCINSCRSVSLTVSVVRGDIRAEVAVQEVRTTCLQNVLPGGVCTLACR